MKIRRFLTFLLTLIIVGCACLAPVDSYARKSKPKAKTTQSAGGKKSKKKDKKKESNGKKGKKGKKSKKDKKGKKEKKQKNGRRGSRNKTTRTKPKRKYKRPASSTPVEAAQNDSLTLAVNAAVLKWVPKEHNPGGLRVNSVKPNDKLHNTAVGLNENFTYLPITQKYINDLKDVVKRAMPDSLQRYTISLNVGRHPLSYYISRIDKLPENARHNTPFITEVDPLSSYAKGMPDDNIALWHSHGRYFRNDAGAWLWQRPLLFQTLEDTYTMSYVLPYIVPMLENAGANVFLPRERDTNRVEVIVDNDVNDGGDIFSQTDFRVTNGAKTWKVGEGEGFIYDLPAFRDTENPFENGTYMEVPTIKNGKPSVAAWYPDIPKQGEYAIYISYKTLPNSTTDAHYTVNYSGGSKEFIVNQKMGGGTWIYLGTFPLRAGHSKTEPVVALTNVSAKGGKTVVTADAIKIGGGMGNIERSARRSDVYYDPSTPAQDLSEEEVEPEEEEEDEGDVDEQEPATPAPEQKPKTGRAPKFSTSGLPRFLEGARYWLHWAGFPESVYSPYHGSNDYKDDYTDRGHWVNYLAGGSRVLPGKPGLNIPIDLSFALHSDAGKRSDNSFVGTLGIYYTKGGASYADGTPRMNSRMLTDLLMRQITNDIRTTYEPRWTRRSMWDKSYLEARVPEVPAALIELMSHQNYADMVYGLDPNFRFTVGRAVYKAMARFLAERKGRELVIQPLPVKDFMIKRGKRKGEFKLSWAPTPDPLEPTAMPEKYVIMERTEGHLGFRKIGESKTPAFTVKVSDNLVHSFKVVAVNAGGISFDSEVLALREGTDGKTPVLIVNGFTRVSGPEHFSENGRAGFRSEEDFGVPYIKDISFSGYQQNYSRSSGNSFGISGSNYVDKIIAGNTFDFVATHGAGIAAAGYGFISASAGAVERGQIKLQDFKLVDLILGKQKATTVGNGKSGVNYIAFPKEMQRHIKDYIRKGGDLLVTGQYVGSDAARSDSTFVEQVLGIRPERASRPSSGRVEVTPQGKKTGISTRDFTYSNTLNEDIYIVENPDIIYPASEGEIIFTLSDNNSPVGILNTRGKSKVLVSSIPFEAIKGEQLRNALMKEMLGVFLK